MPIQTQQTYTGLNLEVGDTLKGHYDLKIDLNTEELYEEFLAYESDAPIEEAAAEFIDERIPHIYDIAEERGVDPKTLDQERREAQKEYSKVSISKVLDGAWENTTTGTCRERSAALKLLYDKIGINTKYQSGSVEDDRKDGHAWVELDRNRIADLSAEPKVFQKERGPHQPGKTVFRKGT
jgi:hypothetical protein